MNSTPRVVSYTRDRWGQIVKRHLHDVSNTLHASHFETTAQYLLEPCVLRQERTEEEKQRRHEHGDKAAKFSRTRVLMPRRDGISNTISTVQKDNLLMETRYRIRKFTPRECFRLMGVTDANIDLIQASGVSKSQQYKMAGNSIVVDVLFHIFRKMLVEQPCEDKLQQASLFPEAEHFIHTHTPLRVVTAFSGYDSQCMALDMLHDWFPHFEYELLAWSEIDKFAIQAHNAVYPQWADRNLGDISKIDWSKIPDFDLFTYSFPCTDISSAGLQKGLSEDSGTRSGLLWECRKTIEAKRPYLLLMENVKALTHKKFMPEFQKWQDYLKEQGYTNYWRVLNAKDYGVPQNRERVFMVSVLEKGVQYHWPRPFPLNRTIADIVETNVDESYYIKEERFNGLKLDMVKNGGECEGVRLVGRVKDE